MGRQHGLTDEKLQDLGDPEASKALTDVERLVLRYADSMTRTPLDVSEELFEQLRVRFNERQLVELTSCIAWENYRARFDHAFGIESEGFSEGSRCEIPT